MWALVLTAVIGAGPPAASSISPHVRTPSTAMQSLLTKAATLPTTSALLRRLDAGDDVIYVVFTSSPEIPTARTRLMAATAAARFIRIDINAHLAPGDRLPILAHELQHAVELADAPGVRDDDGVRRLYERIGTAEGGDHFETALAKEVERRVRRELAGPSIARTIRAERMPKV